MERVQDYHEYGFNALVLMIKTIAHVLYCGFLALILLIFFVVLACLYFLTLVPFVLIGYIVSRIKKEKPYMWGVEVDKK